MFHQFISGIFDTPTCSKSIVKFYLDLYKMKTWEKCCSLFLIDRMIFDLRMMKSWVKLDTIETCWSACMSRPWQVWEGRMAGNIMNRPDHKTLTSASWRLESNFRRSYSIWRLNQVWEEVSWVMMIIMCFFWSNDPSRIEVGKVIIYYTRFLFWA